MGKLDHLQDAGEMEPLDPIEPDPEVFEETFSEAELQAMAKEQQRQNDISTAKAILNQTDYQIIKAAERLLAATSTVDLLATIKALGAEFADTIRLRQECREQVNELEAE